MRDKKTKQMVVCASSAWLRCENARLRIWAARRRLSPTALHISANVGVEAHNCHCKCLMDEVAFASFAPGIFFYLPKIKHHSPNRGPGQAHLPMSRIILWLFAALAVVSVIRQSALTFESVDNLNLHIASSSLCGDVEIQDLSRQNRKEWAEALLAVGQAYASTRGTMGDKCRAANKIAERRVRPLYTLQANERVLMKPTVAQFEEEFRQTWPQILSYFVGHRCAAKQYPKEVVHLRQDEGFALNRKQGEKAPYNRARFSQNPPRSAAQASFRIPSTNMLLWQGVLYLTPPGALESARPTVDKSFAYEIDAACSKARIKLHHSSLLV